MIAVRAQQRRRASRKAIVGIFALGFIWGIATNSRPAVVEVAPTGPAYELRLPVQAQIAKITIDSSRISSVSNTGDLRITLRSGMDAGGNVTGGSIQISPKADHVRLYGVTVNDKAAELPQVQRGQAIRLSEQVFGKFTPGTVITVYYRVE